MPSWIPFWCLCHSGRGLVKGKEWRSMEGHINLNLCELCYQQCRKFMKMISILCQNVLYICLVSHKGCCRTVTQALMIMRPSRNVLGVSSNILTFAYLYAMLFTLWYIDQRLKVKMNKNVPALEVIKIKREHSLVEREWAPFGEGDISGGQGWETQCDLPFCLPTRLFQASSE